MPNIKITDQLGATIDAQLAPASTWLQYGRTLPATLGLLLKGASVPKLQLLTLSDPAVRSIEPGLAFQQPVSLGQDVPALTIDVDAGGSFRILSRTAESSVLFSPDDYGDNIEIPAGACYVAVGFHASAGVGIAGGSSALQFGIDAGAGIAIESFRQFPAGQNAPTIAAALGTSIGEFVIPARAEDFASIPQGVIVTIAGHGSLKFSGTANLLAVANPLATVALPSPLPALSVAQGASVTVRASWEISSEYQVRVQKTGADTVRMGWYRKHDSAFDITATASAGISAGTESTDLWPTLIKAISSDADADLDQLQKAGLPAEQAEEFEDAVHGAVNRKLELSLAAKFGSLSKDEAAFLYDVDLAALDDAAKSAVNAALRGDLGRLADLDSLPAGITGIRSILSKVKESSFALKINLLGIFNYGSVSKLALAGRVTFTPSTGELVIADEATASRIQSSAVNFGADEDKLRHLLAESFLITAAYRGSRSVVSPPSLASSHLFFDMKAEADRDDMRRDAAIVAALGFTAPAIPDGVADFGRTSVLAEAGYDDALSHSLFEHSHAEYEAAGRRAIRALVLPDGDDSFRLKPATDDALWARMSDLGPPSFRLLFPEEQVGAVTADYLAIQWWADSMCTAGEILARMTQQADPSSAGFAELRGDLASCLRDVAAKAHEQFGTPWGLVAMFLASGSAAAASARITGPRVVFIGEPSRATAAIARPSST
jgi:hypothetical protein